MTAIGIFGIAFSRTWERYDSWHVPPEVKDYIESVSPDSVPHQYVDGGKYFQLDTTNIGKDGCHVTAAPEVVLPTGEKRAFSCWLLQPYPLGEVLKWTDRVLDVFRGEYGIIGLYYGRNRFPIRWAGLEEGKGFDRFVHFMISNFPSWEPPEPQPRGRRG